MQLSTRNVCEMCKYSTINKHMITQRPYFLCADHWLILLTFSRSDENVRAKDNLIKKDVPLQTFT